MPYRIRKTGDKYCIETKATGKWKRKQCSDTRAKAESALRLLRGIEHGTLVPRKKKK